MKIIAILFLSFLFISCEDTSTVDNDLSFEEFVVIRSELKANDFFKGVSITRTLLINEKYDIKKAEIKTATAFLKVNGVQVIPLHYTDEGIYKPLYDLLIYSENSYELFAEINGNSVYGFTRVPEPPDLDDASYSGTNYITADVIARPNEVYGAVWAIGTSAENTIKGNNFFSIVPGYTINTPLLISLRTEEIPEEYRDQFYRANTYVQIYAFDQPYLDYFKTKLNNQPLENSFTGSSGPVAWNVKGDNVIGLFIGLAEGGFVKP
jgi:hypothetical protein